MAGGFDASVIDIYFLALMPPSSPFGPFVQHAAKDLQLTLVEMGSIYKGEEFALHSGENHRITSPLRVTFLGIPQACYRLIVQCVLWPLSTLVPTYVVTRGLLSGLFESRQNSMGGPYAYHAAKGCKRGEASM